MAALIAVKQHILRPTTLLIGHIPCLDHQVSFRLGREPPSDTPPLYRAYRLAGVAPAIVPIVSLATYEVDLIAMTDEEAEGHVAAALGCSTVQTPSSRAFVELHRARFGEQAPLTAGAEAPYFQEYLLAEAERRAEDALVQPLLEALAGATFTAPQRQVRIDAQTQHTWLWPRIARLDHQGRFRPVLESSEGVPPSPYRVDYQMEVQR